MMVNEISIEGYRYAIIFTDSFTGMIWVYGLRTKDQTLDALKKWYCDIAQVRLKHKLAILMRDNAGKIDLKPLRTSSSPFMFRAGSVRLMNNGRMGSQKLQSAL
jgi:GTPase SAR1 family protein